jgi:predicted RNase H-like nuclease (RuvC/YqgF family)
MADKDDLSEQAADHIRRLDEHLEKLKRQNAALDSITAAQEAEVEELKRAMSRFAARRERRDD